MFNDIPPYLLHILYIIPSTYMAMFHVMNPIGSGILFTNLTVYADHKTRRKLSKKIAINSFFVMLVVLVLGAFLLRLFGITVPVVQICGGFLIVYMGWNAMVTEAPVVQQSQKDAAGVAENMLTDYTRQQFYPFTFPFTVGPGSIAIMLTVSAETVTSASGAPFMEYGAALIALLMLAGTIYVCYAYADYLLVKLSLDLRKVIMKILSFVLLCIGGQIVVNGVAALLVQLKL